MRHRSSVVLSIASLVLVAPVDGAEHVEVSDDGRRSVSPPAATKGDASAGGLAGVGGVPFPSEPDWESPLRRQVGGLQIADMDGANGLDLVVGCYISNSFPPYDDWRNMIFFNVGGGLEADPSWVSEDEVSTGDVQVGDLNGDGHLDVFSANGGSSMAPSVIYWGGVGGPSTAPGWSSAEPGGAWNNYATLFDLDHDGDLDIVTANQGNSQFDPYRPIHVFENVGGAPSTVPTWSSPEESIQNFLAFGDLDGDGWEDLAVSRWIGFESGVHLNLAGVLEDAASWTTGEDGDDKGVAWSDVDGDGRQDLALGHDPTLLYDNGDDELVPVWDAADAYFGHSDLRFADVDHDGDQDLAEIHFANGHVRIYLNEDGVLATDPAWTWDAPSVGTAIAFGDLNGDGWTDLAVGVSGDPSLYVFYSTLAPPPSCPADLDGSSVVDGADLGALLGGWGGSGAADLNGDGTVDGADLGILLGAWGSCR